MSFWQGGRAAIERLLEEGRLERLQQPAALEWGAQQLGVCERQLDSARTVADGDPDSAFTLAYDAARKAAAVLLQMQGLRARAQGSHATVAEAAAEQFDGPFERLNRYRRMRHTVEYPTPHDAGVAEEDVAVALGDAAAMVETARQLVASGRLAPWRS